MQQRVLASACVAVLLLSAIDAQAQGQQFSFVRGDCNGDGLIDISDPIRVLDVLFAGGLPLACEDAGDANDDGFMNLADSVFLLSHLFNLLAAEPPLPYPACGDDPTADSLDCVGPVSGCPQLPGNQAPYFTSTPPATATEASLFSYDADASDPDVGDSLTYALTVAPQGAVITSGTGLVEWTPTASQVGVHSFTVRVTDSAGAVAHQPFNLTVIDINQAPSIVSTPVLLATASPPYFYDVNATDPDPGDSLTHVLITAPGGVAIDAVTGLISWTPTQSQAGDHPFVVRVVDEGGLFDEQAFTVTVVITNHPPVIVSSPVTQATELVPYEYDVDAIDPDPGDLPTYLLMNAPGGSSIDPVTGVIGWIPTAAQAGSHLVTVRAVDAGGLIDQQTFTVVVVDVNQAPAITSQPSVVATEGQQYLYNVDASDPDLGDSLTFMLAAAPAGATLDPVSGLLAWTPGNGDVGAQSFTVRVTDGAGAFDEQSFLVTVANVNQAPVITSQPVTVASEQVPYSYDVEAADDDPGEILAFSLTTAPGGASIDAGSGLIVWLPSTEQAGAHFFVVRVTDAGGLFDEQAFTVVVADVNQAPEITSSPVTAATEVVLYSYDVSASDPDPGDTLTFALMVAPAGASIAAASGLITWTPSASQSGSHSIVVRVTDAAGAFDEQSFLVLVTDVNQAPVVTSTPVTTVVAETPYAYDVNASDPDPGDVLAYSLLVAPGGATIVSGSGAISWTPAAAQVGPHSFTVRVVDDGSPPESADQSFTVLVQAVPNDPPTITTTAATSGTEGQPYTYAVQATDPDPGSGLVFTLTTAPGGAVIGGSSGIINWTPTGSQLGSQAFIVRVTDGGGLFDEQSFSVVVAAANQPPVITSSPPAAIQEGVLLTYDVDATDPDPGDSLLFSLSAGPAGVVIDPASGVLTWTPSAAQLGSHGISVRATDIGGLFDEQSFTVNVTPAGSGQGAVIARINCGGPAHTDGNGDTWSADFGFNTGNTFTNGSGIAGTVDDVLYQTERWDPSGSPELEYSLVVDPGSYLVRLHFADICTCTSNPGDRVFHVSLEAQQVLTSLDVAGQVGPFTALIEEFEVEVLDGSLQIGFTHVVENPKISAIEVFEATPQGVLTTSASTLVWGHVAVGAAGGVQTLVLNNPSSEPVTIDELVFDPEAGAGHEFEVTLGGSTYTGGALAVTHGVSHTIASGGMSVVLIDFLPSVDGANDVHLEFRGNFPEATVHLVGTGGNDAGHPFLHVVIVAPDFVVDYDQDGFEDVPLVGSDSHTHEPGHALVEFDWIENGLTFGSQADFITSMALGEHLISLTIADDNVPPETLIASATVTVAPIGAVPGLLALVYDAGAGMPSDLLTSVPPQPDRAEEVLVAEINAITPYSGNVMARLLGDVEIPVSGLHEFVVSGGGVSEVRVDGGMVTGPVSLAAGLIELDVRVVVDAPGQLPITVDWLPPGGGPVEPLPSGLLTHDLSAFAPVVNSVFPLTGDESGGNAVAITGLGFFLDSEVVVNWGTQPLTGAVLAVTANGIDLLAPPGSGVISISVTTPRGTSRSFLYSYQDAGPLPISFTTNTVTGAGQASTGEWGPDGRLYVGSRSGELRIITFDDDYTVLAVDTINTIKNQLGSNDEILGLTFNPHDPPSPVKVYVSSGDLYSPGGYPGQVTVLTGPAFDSAVPLVTGLPVSGIDHNVNGMQFDNNGDLYINIGGNTNMGVPGGSMNNLPASPLSGAMVRAKTSLPGFNGTITYVDSISGLPSTDAFQGQLADLAPGVDVEVFGHGLRNPYDLVFTTWGLFYSTDNGPNTGFGPESTGPTTQVPGSGHSDELVLVEYGDFYGHPNRNRGRTDARQNIFHDNVEASIPGVFTQQIWGFPSSTDGIVEYRATTFNNAMRGDLIVQKYNGATSRIVLSTDKRSALQQVNLPFSFGALDVCAGPGGVLFGMNYGGGSVVIAKPNDPSSGMRAFDIFPWRAPATGGHPFIIGGQGFGSDLPTTSVSIGGLLATITAVSGTRIFGVVPAQPAPPLLLQDVVVTAAGETRIITQAFRYLLPPGNEPIN